MPRDRNDSFEPAIVPKKTRRLGNINSVVLSLYSRGMTTRDIEAHLAEVYGATVSRKLISNVTEVVDEIKAWQSRPAGLTGPEPRARKGVGDFAAGRRPAPLSLSLLEANPLRPRRANGTIHP